MKGALVAAAVVVLLSGCASVAPAPSIGAAKGSATPVGTPVADGWQPNERLIPAVKGSIPQLDRPSKREGTTPSGLVYSIYHDGSGGVHPVDNKGFEGWSIDCSRDAMNDKRKCTATSYKANLMIFYGFSATPQSVCILGHDFPGRTGAIRVDGGAPVPTNTDGCAPASLAAQLASGSSVTTRRVEWPYDYSRDETASIQGAGETMQLITFIRENVDRLTF